MKSTYKLFGTYWDGMKAVKYDELQKDSHPTQPSDLISFQTLLSVQNQADFDHIIAPYKMNDEITIQVDYWTETSNPVLRMFLEKRLGQMVAHLSEKYPAVYCIKA